MADTALILGLAGIGGTVGGVVATNATTYALERRRDRRDESSARRDVLRAIRLTELELREDAETLSSCGAGEKWWPPSDAPRRDAWEAHQSSLAGSLQQDEWEAVAGAYAGVHRAVAMHADYASTLQSDENADMELPFEQDERDALATWQGWMEEGADALAAAGARYASVLDTAR